MSECLDSTTLVNSGKREEHKKQRQPQREVVWPWNPQNTVDILQGLLTLPPHLQHLASLSTLPPTQPAGCKTKSIKNHWCLPSSDLPGDRTQYFRARRSQAVSWSRNQSLAPLPGKPGLLSGSMKRIDNWEVSRSRGIQIIIFWFYVSGRLSKDRVPSKAVRFERLCVS
jgi:hypothetical protein